MLELFMDFQAYPPPTTGSTLLAVGLTAFLAHQILLCIYNLYFHPCARYPGPLLARMSIFPDLYYAWKGTKHMWADDLHRRYGPVIRLEPSFLSITTTGAVQSLYAHGSSFEKATFYHRGSPQTQVLTNLATATDKKVHSRKRRIIAQAFSEASIRSYEATLLDKDRIFCQRICDPSTFGGKYKNMARWFSYLTYDTMGVLTFSHEYNMLTTEDDHFIQPLIDTFQHSQVVLGVVPWVERWGLAPLLFVRILGAVTRFRKYVDKQVAFRIDQEKSGKGTRDIFKILLDHEDKGTGERMEFKELSDEAVVLIIAASDTTGTALSGLWFYLAKYTECYSKLKDEVRSTFSDVEEIISGDKLRGCKYLRACVEEALRMSPGVPGYLTRESARDESIDGHFIPAGTQIGAPGWTTHRNPDIYPDPQTYMPERWMTESVEELQRLRSVHFPFSYGQRACIGKNLAYNSIYLITARLVFLFEIESRDVLPLEYHVKDHFAAGEKDGPYLAFMKRSLESEWYSH